MLGKGFPASPRGRMWTKRKRRHLWIVGSLPREESAPVVPPSQLSDGGGKTKSIEGRHEDADITESCTASS